MACAALIAGCTTIAPAPTPAPASENVAVAELVRGARTNAETGRLAEAAASLERALRIEPRNPRLWHDRLRAENWRLIAEARSARGDAAGARAALERAAPTGR